MDVAGTPGQDPGSGAPGPVEQGPVEQGTDAPGPVAPTPGRPAGETTGSAATAKPAPSGRLTGSDAARAHLTLVLGLAVCVTAFWFELHRALSGNGLSWASVFEWPMFAVFAVYMWWNVLNGGRAVRRRRPTRPGPSLDPRYTGMLEAWEAHQRELQASWAAPEPPEPGADTSGDDPDGGADDLPVA
jgi:hypothetical protein